MTQPLGEEFILIKPLLTGFRAALETELKAALAGVQARVPVVAAQAAAATRAAIAPAAAAQAVPASAVAVTQRLTAATTEAAVAERQLGAAAATTKAELGGVILPAGVRDVVVVSQAAAKAQTELATATKVTKEQLAGIVLPPGIRSVTVAANEAAAAQQNLARSTRAAKAELALAAPAAPALLPGETLRPSGLIIPPPAATVGNQEAIKAEKELAATTKATRAELETLGPVQRNIGRESANLARNVKTAETAVGRYSRGVVAATVASTGFFRAVSFASGAFLVGAGVGATIGAAVQEFKQMTVVGAQTAAILKATGDSANVTAGQINDLALAQLKLTGTDDELVKQAANVLLTFRGIRNEVGAGNDVFNRSVKAVQDISSVFGTALTGSAVQLGKALQDPIRGVTALRRSGITLSQSQRDLIKNLVETGRTFTAQKIILGEVERQVGGTAAAIGKTLPGQLAILRESAKNSLGEFVKRISESRDAAQAFASFTKGFGDAFSVILAPLKLVASALGTLVKGAESLGVLRPLVQAATLAAVGFGALKLALFAASAAQTLYARSVAVATGASAKEAVAIGATTAALRVQTGAAATSTLATTATAATNLGIAARASAIGLGAGRLALAAVGGVAGAVALGLGAVTVAIIKMNQAAARAPGTLKGFENALKPFQANLGRIQTLRQQLAAASEDVSISRFDVSAAGRGVTSARTAARTSRAQPGSVEQLFLANRLAVALDKQRQAEDDLARSIEKQERLQRQLTATQLAQPFVIGNTTKSLKQQIETIQGIRANVVKGPLGEGLTFQRTPDIAEQVSKAVKLLSTLQRSGNQTARAVASPLLAIIGVLDRFPTQQEIRLVFKLVGLGRSQQDILSQLGVIGDLGGRGQIGTREVILKTAAGRVQENATLREQERALQANINLEAKRLATVKDIQATRRQDLATAHEQTDAARQALQAAQDQQASARQALADARQAAREARQSVVDTIAAGKLAIADAVTSAKSNLDQLGQAIAEALGQAGQTISGALSAEQFNRIKERIRAGAGGPDTQQVRQQLQSEIQGGAAAAAPDVTRKFADLTDALNRGKLTLPQFTRQFNALLKGIDFKKIRQQQGAAAANLLRDQIAAFRAQARLIAQGPQRAGGGTRQQLIDPATAVKQAALDVAASQRQLSASLRNVRTSQRDLQRSNEDLRRAEIRVRTAQSEETRANTRAIRAHTRVLEQQNALLRAQRAKQDKPKANNKAAKDSGDLNIVGATSP